MTLVHLYIRLNCTTLAFLLLILMFGGCQSKNQTDNDKEQPGVVSTPSWRVRAGDSLAWKERNYNDSPWAKTANTYYLVENLKKIPTGIHWYRTTLNINKNEIGKAYELKMKIVGACEVYLDGHLEGSFGSIDKKESLIMHISYATIATVHFNDDKKHILAIRYRYPEIDQWAKKYKMRNRTIGFSVMDSFLQSTKPVYFSYTSEFVFVAFLFGIFIIKVLSSISTIDFRRNKEQSTILGIFFIVAIYILVITGIYFKSLEPSDYFFLTKVWPICSFILTASQANIFFKSFGNRHLRIFIVAVLFELAACILCDYNNRTILPLSVNALFTISNLLHLPLPLFLLFIAWTSPIITKSRWGKILNICLLISLILVVAIPFDFIKKAGSDSLNWLLFLSPVSMLLFSIFHMMQSGRDTALELNKKLKEVKRLSAEKEAYLTQQNTIFEQQVAERTAQLKASNQTKDLLLSIISHDLRSPIVSQKMLLELLRDELIDRKEFTRLSTYMLEKLTQLDETLDNLLNWSMSQMDILVTKKEYLPLMPIIKGSVNLLESTAYFKNISFDIAKSANEKVYGDKNHIQTIIRNLIHNAIKFSPIDSKIDIKVKRKDNKVIITIKNPGEGINEDGLSDMFSSPKISSGLSKEKGTGLGLMLCKDLAEKNNGQIILENDQLNNTIATVILEAKSS